jgi:hypothetical protein
LHFWQTILLILNLAIISTAFITFIAIKDLSGVNVPSYEPPVKDLIPDGVSSIGPDDSVSRVGSQIKQGGEGDMNSEATVASTDDMRWYEPSFWNSKTTIIGNNGKVELQWWVHVLLIRTQIAIAFSLVSNLLLSTSSDLKWKFLSVMLLLAIVLNIGNFSHICCKRAHVKRAKLSNTLIGEYFPAPDVSAAMITGSIPYGTPEREDSETFLKDNITSFIAMRRKELTLPRSKHTVEVAAVIKDEPEKEVPISFSSNRPYVDALLAGVMNKAILLDSGASLSMIPGFMVEEIEAKLGEKLPDYIDDEPVGALNLTSVTGTPIKVIRKILMPVTIGLSVIHCPMAVTGTLEMKSPIFGVNFISKAFQKMKMSPTGEVSVQTWDGLHYTCKMGRGARTVAACGLIKVPSGEAVRATLYMPSLGRKTEVIDGGVPVHVEIKPEYIPPEPRKGLMIDQVARVAKSGKIRVDILNQSMTDMVIADGQEIATLTDLGSGIKDFSVEAEYVDKDDIAMPLKDFNKKKCICSYDKIIDILDCSGFTCRGADQIVSDKEIRGPFKEDVTTLPNGTERGFRMGVLNNPKREFKNTQREIVKALEGLKKDNYLPTDNNKVLVLAPHLTRFTFNLVHCIRSALIKQELEPEFGFLDEAMSEADCGKCYKNRFCAQVDRKETVRVPDVFISIPNQEGEIDTDYLGERTRVNGLTEKGAFSIPTGNVSWIRLSKNAYLFVIHHPDVWYNVKKLTFALQCTLAAIKPCFPKARVKVYTSEPVVRGVTTSALVTASTLALQRSDYMEYALRMGEKNPIKRKDEGVVNTDSLAMKLSGCACFLCRTENGEVKNILELGSKRMKVMSYMLHPDQRSCVKVKDLKGTISDMSSISEYASEESEPPDHGKCTDTVTEINPPKKILQRGIDTLDQLKIAKVSVQDSTANPVEELTDLRTKYRPKGVKVNDTYPPFSELHVEHVPSEASSAPVFYKKPVDEEMEKHLRSLENEETFESIPKAAWSKDNDIEEPMDHIDMEHTRDDDIEIVKRLIYRFKDTTISFNKNDHSVILNHWLRLKVKFNGTYYAKPIVYSNDMLEVLLGLVDYQIKAGIIANIDSLYFSSPIFCVPHNSAEKAKLLEYHKKRASGEVIVPLTDEQLKEAPIGTNRVNHVRYRLIYDAVKLNTHVCKVPGDNLIRNTQLSISSVVKAETLSLLDVKGAFTSLPVSVMSRRWLGLALQDYRLLCFCFAPLGLSIVPSVFSRILMGAVRPSVRKHCRFHLDDILLFSTRKDHPKLLEELFEDLEKVGMLVDAKKLQLMKTEVVYLGFHLKNSKQSIQQISYQVDIELPTTRTELAAFLGRFNYFSSFIAGFGMLAALLHPLLKANTKFAPSTVQTRAMKEIVRLFLKAPSLYLLDPSKELYISCDASIIGAGSVLFQRSQEPGEEEYRILGYFSCKFNALQIRNCSSLEMELLSIIRVISAHKHLVSMGMPIIVLTDCKVLCCLRALSGCISNSKLARWFACLESMAPDLTLKWTSSKDPMIGMADYLSRMGEKHVRLASKYVVNLKAKNNLHAAVDALFRGWKIDDRILTHHDIKEIGEIIGQSPLFQDVLDALKRTSKKTSMSVINDKELSEDDVQTILDRDDDDEDRQELVRTLNDYQDKKDLNTEAPVKEGPVEDDPVEALTEKDQSENKSSFTRYGNGADDDFISSLPILLDEGKDDIETQLAAVSIGNPEVMAFGDQRPRGEVDGVLPLTYERILHEQRNDEKIQHIIKRIKLPSGNRKLKDKFSLQAGLLYRTPHGNQGPPREYLTERLIVETMALIHTYYGHVGVHSLLTRFKMSYTGKNLEKYARLITRGCYTCKSIRPPTGRDVNPGHIPLGAGWGTVWVMDHIQMNPVISGGRQFKYYLNIFDLTTRFSMGRPTTNMRGSETVRLVKDLISIVGKVHTIRTDGGPGLGGSTEFLDFARSWGITIKTGVPNRPTAHSQAEVSNLLVKLGLLSHSKAYGLPWPSISWLNNSSINHIPRKYDIIDPDTGKERTVRASPQQLVYGWDSPLVNLHNRHQSRVAYSTQVKIIEGIQRYADKINDQRRKEDQSRKEGYGVGDLVLLKNTKLARTKQWCFPSIFEVVGRTHRMVKIRIFLGNTHHTGVKIVHVSELKSFHTLEELKILPSPLAKRFGPCTRPIILPDPLKLKFKPNNFVRILDTEGEEDLVPHAPTDSIDDGESFEGQQPPPLPRRNRTPDVGSVGASGENRG